MDWRLAVTRRALRDLHVNVRVHAGRDPEDLRDEHQLLQKFVELRSERPIGQEPTLGITGFWNLHGTNPWRGVTWHDEASGVVWLCAAGPHDYGEFVDLDRVGDLVPNTQDYADLEQRIESEQQQPFEDVATPQILRLRAKAEASPGEEQSDFIADEVQVSMLFEQLDPSEPEADLYVGIQLPRVGVRPLPPRDISVVMASMVCGEDVAFGSDAIDWNVGHFPRPDGRRPNEVVIRWRRP